MSRNDQLFHKRKARKASSFQRKQAKRAQYDMVLIVCEGEKTEPNYLQSLIDDLQLNTANIRVLKNTSGSDPRTIVDFALKEYRKEKEYNRVYCVFDKDRHPNYAEALDVINRTRMAKDHDILATTSVPCFEFWFLLHFTYTTKQYDTGSGSICNNVIAELKRYLPDYAKGSVDTYAVTKDHLGQAIIYAKRVLKYCESAGTDMPSTTVHELVEYLQDLKKSVSV